MLGKRGVADSAIDWLVALIITSIALVILMVIVGVFTTRDISTQTIEPDFFVAKVYYGLGVEFSEDEFKDDLFSYKEPHLAAKMTVSDLEGNEKKVIFQNKDAYDRILPLANNLVAGGGYYENFTYPVVYDDENAHLLIEVVVE